MSITQISKKQKEIFLYLLFGGFTTLVNWGSYWMLADLLHCGTVFSTVLAWFLSVAFAFVTNKLLVFSSHSKAPKQLLLEIGSFFGCRVFSGVLDLGIMWLTVDCLLWNNLLMKLLSNVIVVILNYFFSKWIIFRKPAKHTNQI